MIYQCELRRPTKRGEAVRMSWLPKKAAWVGCRVRIFDEGEIHVWTVTRVHGTAKERMIAASPWGRVAFAITKED